jgi:uncharacterized OB-fold protein
MTSRKTKPKDMLGAELPGKKCARCGLIFYNITPFVTCFNCRIPLNQESSGCNRWQGVVNERKNIR